MDNSAFLCKIIRLSDLQIFSVISMADFVWSTYVFSAAKLIIGNHLELRVTD